MMKLQSAFWSLVAAIVLLPSVASAEFVGVWDNAGKLNARAAGLPEGSIFNIIQTTMGWLLAVLGFFSIIGFVIAGILYLTAAGDEGRMEKGKNAMLYSIMGIIAALIGFVILQAVDKWLEGGSATPF